MCIALDDHISHHIHEVDARRNDLLEVLTEIDHDWLLVRNTTMANAHARYGNNFWVHSGDQGQRLVKCGVIEKRWVELLPEDCLKTFSSTTDKDVTQTMSLSSDEEHGAIKKMRKSLPAPPGYDYALRFSRSMSSSSTASENEH